MGQAFSNITRQTLLLVTLAVVFLAMAFQMPNFLARLFRPLSTTSRMSITGDATNGIGGGGGLTSLPEGAEKATVAAGCFWGVEHLYRKHFGGKGLYDARVGYIGGDVNNPTYRAVCRGDTGHAEATQIIYDPTKITYQQLLEFFYRMHDPTTANSQGPDVGSQYRSGIFTHGPEQERVAREVTAAVNDQWWKGRVVTEVLPAGRWWDAEDYHQEYLHKNPSGYECPSHFLRSFPDPK